MDDIKIVPRVSIPKVGMQSVRMPIVGNNMDSAIMSIFKDLKSHMIGWYDVKRQGCTNESLTANPVLEDLSDGQYVFDFNEYTIGKIHIINSRVIKGGSVRIPYNEMTHDIEPFNIRVDNITEGNIFYYYRNSEGTELKFTINANGLYTVPKCFNVEGTGFGTGFTFSGTNEGITITMLPTKHPLELRNFVFGGLSGMGTEKYPNSLVFNGTTPTWVYDRSNFKFASAIYGEWINNNIAHVIKGTNSTGTYFLSKQVIGQKGEILNVNIPSFKVRVKGINGIYIRFNYNECNGHSCTWNKEYVRIDEDSTIIFPAISSNINPYDEESTPFYRFDCTMGDKDSGPVSDTPVDITIEFLPNYPAPTTRMYGAIPSLTQGAKCMMMDFVPINEKSTVLSQGCCYYSQIAIDVKNYSIYSFNDIYDNFDKETAYNGRNSNGTFINCVKNDKRITALSLFQKRQVVGVNTQNPANTYPVIGTSNTLNHNAQMALNSLLLFDKELTEEEMKVVMDRIMKYKNVDGIDMLSAPDKIGFTVGEYDGGGDIWEID